MTQTNNQHIDLEQTDTENMASSITRHEFTILFDVTNGNPNGDPDMGNMPRIDPETGHGIVTDVCLKRKVRNYIEITREQGTGHRIYVTEGAVLNEQHRKAYRSVREEDVDKAKELKPKDRAEAIRLTHWMCDNFYDVRAFGAVMTTKVNCGQVRGPVQFTFARSIDPIFSQETTITRMAVTQEGTDKEREMGRKHIVPYGLYRMDGYVSGHLADKTHFGQADLELLWESLENMFEHDRSASRGQMALRKLIIFEHASKLGNAPAHKLFESIRVHKIGDAPARAYTDYEIDIVTDELPEGVTVVER
ncbi:type I-C CRISPR-associated protein Cas7/Csd2 [Paenibacillus hunanensis]|uniref:CRISPR-associated protein Csd2 n=2 Tax=Paenibacillus hunanensis TaxID=539262 RepID=A0ABU1IZ53_9BACL|nr:type I-C CRISPR-associated protein Cas7/Csd2 [Paenibacillus hunanensis]MDR6243612.1 CRISPR-associated protein Csd2 [Paenibacillus hunanensis]GGJ23373.1 type I-C CRISPR-associated protein Cas7/Csd2 [Paenibacillus hunanensis]